MMLAGHPTWAGMLPPTIKLRRFECIDPLTDKWLLLLNHRSYHLIATACKDGHVRIFKLTDDSQGGALTGGWSRKMFNVTCIADFADHNAEVTILILDMRSSRTMEQSRLNGCTLC